MSIDDKSLWLGIAIGITLPVVITIIGIAVSHFIQKIRDSIADRKLGLIKENAILANEISQLRNRIRELEENEDDGRKDN